jgi:hypothetical protein
LAACCLAVFGRGNPIRRGDWQIVVSGADIDRLATAFSRTRNRPPDATELQAQIQDYIREEVLYRATQLGLDKEDSIIRRRLRQKMEFLFEDTVRPPQEAELRAYLQSHIDSSACATDVPTGLRQRTARDAAEPMRGRSFRALPPTRRGGG